MTNPVLETIRARRSVRKYTGEPVPATRWRRLLRPGAGRRAEETARAPIFL